MAKCKTVGEVKDWVIFASSLTFGSNGFQNGVWEGLLSIPLELLEKVIQSFTSRPLH